MSRTHPDTSGARPATIALAATVLGLAAIGPAAAACPPANWPEARLAELRGREFKLDDEGERNRLALGLVDCLADPNPRLRDEAAMGALSAWLRGKALAADTQQALARQALALLQRGADSAGFGQPFAALLLSEVVRADRIQPALAQETLGTIALAATSYLLSLNDYRDFDARDGWRHAPAHAADLVLQLGVNPRVAAAAVEALLRALATQISPAAVHAYVTSEPERLARAVFFIHQRGVVEAAFWDSWFSALGAPAPLVAWADAFSSRAGLARRHNLLAFLHALAFATRAQTGPRSEALATLVDREIRRVMGG